MCLSEVACSVYFFMIRKIFGFLIIMFFSSNSYFVIFVFSKTIGVKKMQNYGTQLGVEGRSARSLS